MRAEMARRNATARQLREHLGMSRSAMHRRLSAQHPFDVAELSAVSRFLDIPLSSLLGETTQAGAA